MSSCRDLVVVVVETDVCRDISYPSKVYQCNGSRDWHITNQYQGHELTICLDTCVRGDGCVQLATETFDSGVTALTVVVSEPSSRMWRQSVGRPRCECSEHIPLKYSDVVIHG